MRDKKFNNELSERLHTQIEAKPNACFSNAIKVLNFIDRADYVEGYILSPSSQKPNHHAWLELDETIIDPSLPDGNREYFFGGRRTKEEYIEIVERCTERIEAEKKKGPPLLPDRVMKDLQPDILQRILNPDYDKLLEKFIERQMSLSSDKKVELEQAYTEARAFQEKYGWSL